MSDPIDPIRYGVLWQKVEELDKILKKKADMDSQTIINTVLK